MSEPASISSDLDRLDLGEIKRFIRRRWLLVAATAVTCTVLAAIVCVAMTPVFTATSQILLDPRKQHVFGQDSIATDSSLDSSIVDSQIPILLSTRLLAKVATKENLAEDPEFAPTTRVGLTERLMSLFRPAKPRNAGSPTLDGIDPKLAAVVLRLFNKIDISRVAKSYVISISVSSRDAAKAARLANTLAQTYVEDQVDVHAKSVQQAATFFEDRLGSLRDQVRQSERAVAEYRKAHGFTTTVMDNGRVTVSEQQLQNLNQQLALATTDTAEKLARYEQASHSTVNGAALDTLPEIIRSTAIAQLRGQQADLERRAADLSAVYGPAYPAISQIRAQRAGIDRAIAAEIKRIASGLKNDYEVAKVREDALRRNIARLGAVSGGDSEEGVKLRELERTNLANKALFENFLNRAKLTQEQSSFEEPDARLISPALEPTSPSSPKIKLILPVALVAGLLLGLGLAALLDARAPREADDPVARADAFIIGRIPEIYARRGGAVDCAAHVAAHPDGGFARSVDLVAGRLSAIGKDGKRGQRGKGGVVLLAPLGAGDGATSLAACLAAAAGRAGRRVLLVDADGRGGGLSAAIGADTGTDTGLGEVLAGEAKLGDAALPQAQFALLACGRKPLDTPAASRRLRAVLAEARRRYDLVLVDAPARGREGVGTAFDALADAVVLVASWDNLMRDGSVAAIDAVADKENFAGIILNKVDAAEDEDFALAS